MMKNEKYPKNAIIIELLFGWIFGAMGIGHIYAGNFLSGICILLFYYVLLAIELLFALPLFIAGLLLYIILIPIQNLFFAILSIYALKKNASEMFARMILSLIIFSSGMISLLLFTRSNSKEIGFGIFFLALILVFAIINTHSKDEKNNGNS